MEMTLMSRFSTALSFMSVCVILLSPEIIKSKSEGQDPHNKLVTFLKLVHFLCFSTAWGATLWVVILGIIWFRTLPRHQFGNLRSKMFPACFSVVEPCCAVSVASFGYLYPWKTVSTTHKYQLGFLIAAFAFNFSNHALFTPITLKMMRQRHKIEKEVNIGEDIGWTKNREVAKVNQELAAMNNKFNKVHGLSALALILYFGSLTMHFWYLASQMDF